MADSFSMMVSFPGDGEPISGYLAQPLIEGEYPGVIVIQEWAGLVDHIKEVAMRLARQGYVALAPDLFHGQVGRTLEQCMQLSGALDDRIAFRDLTAGFRYLQTLPMVDSQHIGCIGFCLGGRQSMLFAGRNQDLRAAVAFYGRIFNPAITDRSPVHPIDLAPQIRCPFLGIFGEADTSIPMEHVAKLREALEKNNKTFEMYTYPGAEHAFANETNAARHNPEATKDAWDKTLAFFRRYLEG
ncbi:MAG: dienelactone hydrolase family protein [Chloroflexi bacterium]|nr:dienelactone hydrolase family protein [Chloroflexota bacterium]